MHVVLFTDISNHPIPVKTIGAYKIASVLRQHGYKVVVINDINYIVQNRLNDLIDYLDEIITDETLYFGISTTFLTVALNSQNTPMIDNKGKVKRYYDYEDDEIPNNFHLYPLFEKFMSKLREYNKKIIIGGYTQTSYLLYNLLKPDHWVQGLAESSIVKFTKEIKQNKDIPKMIKYDTFASLHDFHNTSETFSNDDIILENETLPIEFSRGCRFKCKFCSYPLLGRNPKDNRYVRSEESIFKEMKHNYDNFGTQNYYFLCDTFNETTEKIQVVKNSIDNIGLDCKFFSYLRIELLHKHPEQISMLRDMGIGACYFGIESLNRQSAKYIGKGLDTDLILKTIDRCKESWGNETIIHASFIIGLPHDSPKKCDEWTKTIINGETNLDSVSFRPLIMSNNIKEEYIFHSEFEKNMSKYGYEKNGDKWKNKDWTYEDASEYAKNINYECFKSKKYKVYPFNALMYLSADFTWDEIISTRRGEIMYNKIQNESIIRGDEKRNEYFNRLINI